MKRFLILFGLLASVFLMSCNKTPLITKELKLYVGTWQWYKTQYTTLSPPIEVTTITESDVADIYTIRIKSSGKMIWYKNNDIVREINIKVTGTHDGSECSHRMYYNSHSNGIYITHDNCGELEQIILEGIQFPFTTPENEFNYFRKID